MTFTVTMETELFVLVSLLVTLCLGQTTPVIISDTASLILLPENTPVGSVIRTLDAQDADGDAVDILFPNYNSEYLLFTLNQTTKGPPTASADLILIQPLDRDFHSSTRKLIFLLRDDESPTPLETIVKIDMFISDVNDESPVYHNLPYRVFISEDTSVGTVIYTGIQATDPDTGRGGRVTYSIEPITQSISDAQIFIDTYSIDPITGDVTLTQVLDYEKLRFYQFQVTAQDGVGLNTTEEFIVTLLDVQDTSPQFQGTPYVISVPESIPVGDHFFTVRGFDGDRGVSNDVVFLFTGGYCIDMFNIDNRTGEVTVVTALDRDSGAIALNNGVCELQVQIHEVYTNSSSSTDNATTSLTIFIDDVNDNPPRFNVDSYSVILEDTAQINFPLRFANDQKMTVADTDQGSHSVVEIVLRYLDGSLCYDFEPDPSILAGSSPLIIKLKNPNILREGRDQIKLIVYGEERDTSERLSATATVVIDIMSVTTTTVATTTEPPTTTEFFQDPFIPSVLGVVFTFLLIIWAIVFTIYYCLRKRKANTRVGVANGNAHRPPAEMDPTVPFPPPTKATFTRTNASNA